MNARDAAQQAAEAIHALNYATLPADGYPGLEYPSNVYDVIGSLAHAAGMLPQALDQLRRWINDQTAAGRIEIYEATVRPEAAAQTTALALVDAVTATTDLLNALNRAHSATAYMAHKGPEDES